MSHDTLLLRAAFLVAAVALVAAPYWRRITEFVAQATKASVPYRADIARGVAAVALLAIGTGLVPVSFLKPQSPLTVDSALIAARVAAGLWLVVNAALLFAKPADSVLQRVQRSTKDAVIAVVLVAGTPLLPVSTGEWKVTLPSSPVVAPSVSAVVYVYEKDETAIPVGVSSGINKLNRDKKVVASLFERDTVDGTGQTPDQFKPALEAARRESIPSLIVLSGTSVVKVVKSPKTETEVLGAVP